LGVHLQDWDYVVALAGNPNTGKSTVFNALTGLRQHTGNWPGKTVARAEGGFAYAEKRYKLIDLPGTYSLLATSVDEEIARDFILFGQPDVTVIVVDAMQLERNLNLVFQVLEITGRAVICLNMMDEARRHGFHVDDRWLARHIGVPVVPASARYNEGLTQLTQAIHEMATGQSVSTPRRIATESPAVKRAVDELSEAVTRLYPTLPNSRWVAMRLLDDDRRMGDALRTGELNDLQHEQLLEGTEGAQLSTPDQSAAGEAVLALASNLRWTVEEDFQRSVLETIYGEAARVVDTAVTRGKRQGGFDFDRALDRVVTSRRFGFPIMLLLLTLVFWITVVGANYPSSLLSWLLLDVGHTTLKRGSEYVGLPWWLDGIAIDGVYLCTAWVVAVMLPPMAIFFPLFTLLEDFGYLPRVTFNLDALFRRVGAHGKQSLTMCMGFGCNAAGVIACRVIDSPRERLIAILTNNFSLCNGRWPIQILLASIFLGALAPALLAGMITALAVVGVALFGVALAFLASWALSRTLLEGEVSTFSLELPPYRPPRLWQTVYTSLFDRTIFVLWRAIAFAAPAGAVIWLVSNIHLGGASIAEHLIGWLDPIGLMVGMNGIVLLAYLVAIPANEIVIPTILMLTVLAGGLAGVGEGAGVIFELESVNATRSVLEAGNWTILTAINVMMFSLLHNPCSTTIYTIWKETGSVKWTAVATFLPLLLGIIVCFVLTQIWRIVMGW
jgi:ferrous iron transport protein B